MSRRPAHGRGGGQGPLTRGRTHRGRLRALDARLTGEAIPLAARLMQICDGYDALRSKRPYKQPIDRARCVGIITRGNGRVEPEHFDPAVLACFSAHAKNSALSTSGLPMPDGKKG